MRGLGPGTLAIVVSAVFLACTPKLTPPRESTRISGVVKDVATADAPRPVGVMVYERCSSLLLVLSKCPGKFLGEAKLARPGPFVVEVDSRSPEVRVFAFRGFLSQEEACADVTVPIAEANKPVEIQLTAGPCSEKLTRP
jgi:hypothetical protein